MNINFNYKVSLSADELLEASPLIRHFQPTLARDNKSLFDDKKFAQLSPNFLLGQVVPS
jgi:hypothetical protein